MCSYICDTLYRQRSCCSVKQKPQTTKQCARFHISLPVQFKPQTGFFERQEVCVVTRLSARDAELAVPKVIIDLDVDPVLSDGVIESAE